MLSQKPYSEIDYVLALADNSRIGALRFRASPDEPFLATATGVILPLVRLAALLRSADAIHSETETAEDLRELWRRLIFSLLASNCDDHLRNHGFLMREAGRWSLSPACDLNPVPEMDRSRVNKTPTTEDHWEPGIQVARSAASRFGLPSHEAKAILGEVFSAVSTWRNAGQRLRLKATTLDAYASAFENPCMQEAARLLGKK